MSQGPLGATVSDDASGFPSEEQATSPGPTKDLRSSAVSGSTSKLRSCIICRSRKVRCDKQSPCSNCRRAGIACVSPSTDRPPRWVRRLQRSADHIATPDNPAPQDAHAGVERLMERLRSLEDLVKELKGQLAQAHAAASSTGSGPSAANSPDYPAEHADASHQETTISIPESVNLHTRFGRLVLQDASRTHYVSSGFWSRVDDELNGLKLDAHNLADAESDSEEEEASPEKPAYSQELEQTPWERHAFLFRDSHSAASSDLRDFHPLPSQIPFLLDVFSENVNLFFRIIHLPTVTQMIRQIRSSGLTSLTPSNEALMFGIYYAAMTSMEEDDAMINFGCSRHELCLRYRLGLERALAKADFLNAPDIALVQAFAIFICLARRHESPRYVWMMTGLVIRMAQYLGLQRDGDQLGQLTPFEIEMRRRVWWGLCMLDLRTSEDQGTDLTIAQGSFDTKMPSNINDADIGPKSASMPPGREGVTDLSFSRISAGVTALMRQMVDPRTRRDVAGLEDQSRLLNEIHQKFESEYLQHATESGNIAYWVISSVARLIMAKMTLIVFLPVLFSPTAERVSEEIRTKLLVSAIEVAEYNHALNAEQACRHWRWVYQTHTHWHAIVYLLIEVARRPWSPMIERAWVALHSSWLIPAHVRKDKNSRIWVPLRKLMDKARLHRESELNRLQADPQAAAMLELEDYNLPLPSSPGPFPNGASSEVFRDRWRQLVAVPEAFGSGTHIHGIPAADAMKPSTNITYASQLNARSVPAPTEVVTTSNMTFDHGYLQTSGQQISEVHGLDNTTSLDTVIGSEPAPASGSGQTTGASYMSFPTVTADWSDVRTMGPGFTPWLWVDGEPSVEAFSGNVGPVDANVDLDIDVNWYEWVKTAKDME